MAVHDFVQTGLVAAPHTPFDAEGGLALDRVERQAEALAASGVRAAFVGGSTGEFQALTVLERADLVDRWVAAGHAAGLVVFAHVGGTQVEAGVELARRAAAAGADAIAALMPHYFRPTNVGEQVAVAARYAGAAPDLPYYHYEIPALTGITLPVADFLGRAVETIPNLRGVKFTSGDLVALQRVLAVPTFDRPGLDVLFGCDEVLLAALPFGVRGAVGSTYNFAPGVYQRLAAAWTAGDFEAARLEQHRSLLLVDRLAARGYMAAAKALMAELGVDVGPPRLPSVSLSASVRDGLFTELHEIGFFDWRLAPPAIRDRAW